MNKFCSTDFSLCKIFEAKGYTLKLTVSILLLWLSTFVHHLYGAVVYDTFWRIIAPLFVFPPLLWLTLYLQNKVEKKSLSIFPKITYYFMVLFIWAIPIGFVEGGYGHLLKNILFFSNSFDSVTLHRLFPPEFGKTKLFENPNDYFFELTGVLQFPVACFTLYYLYRFSKK